MEVTVVDDQAVNLQEKLKFFFEGNEHHHEFCPIKDIMDRFGDKWSLFVILYLGYSGTTRFNKLKNKIEGISQRMLTVTLRSLERDGLLVRRIYAEVPPRVEYELTDLGIGLLRKIVDLAQWAAGNMDAVLKSRMEYDSKIQ